MPVSDSLESVVSLLRLLGLLLVIGGTVAVGYAVWLFAEHTRERWDNRPPDRDEVSARWRRWSGQSENGPPGGWRGGDSV